MHYYALLTVTPGNSLGGELGCSRRQEEWRLPPLSPTVAVVAVEAAVAESRRTGLSSWLLPVSMLRTGSTCGLKRELVHQIKLMGTLFVNYIKLN